MTRLLCVLHDEKTTRQQVRKDRLMLGKTAFDCGGDGARWQRQLAPFLNDVVVS
jgi:hypothetical protein